MKGKQVCWLRLKFKKCTAGKAAVLKFVKNCKHPLKLKCNYNIVSNIMCIQRNLLALPLMNFYHQSLPQTFCQGGVFNDAEGQFNSFAETIKEVQRNCHNKSSFTSKQTYKKQYQVNWSNIKWVKLTQCGLECLVSRYSSYLALFVKQWKWKLLCIYILSSPTDMMWRERLRF